MNFTNFNPPKPQTETHQKNIKNIIQNINHLKNRKIKHTPTQQVKAPNTLQPESTANFGSLNRQSVGSSLQGAHGPDDFVRTAQSNASLPAQINRMGPQALGMSAAVEGGHPPQQHLRQSSHGVRAKSGSHSNQNNQAVVNAYLKNRQIPHQTNQGQGFQSSYMYANQPKPTKLNKAQGRSLSDNFGGKKPQSGPASLDAVPGPMNPHHAPTQFIPQNQNKIKHKVVALNQKLSNIYNQGGHNIHNSLISHSRNQATGANLAGIAGQLAFSKTADNEHPSTLPAGSIVGKLNVTAGHGPPFHNKGFNKTINFNQVESVAQGEAKRDALVRPQKGTRSSSMNQAEAEQKKNKSHGRLQSSGSLNDQANVKKHLGSGEYGTGSLDQIQVVNKNQITPKQPQRRMSPKLTGQIILNNKAPGHG